eukprot:4025903-Prymnesium_polylepis.1
MGAARVCSLALGVGLGAQSSRHGTARLCSQGTDMRGSRSLVGAWRWRRRRTAHGMAPLAVAPWAR